MNTLNENHYEAIEQKYRGVSHKDIARSLHTPKGTVDDWFRSRGLLHREYEEYCEEMRRIRIQRISERMEVDEDYIYHLLIKVYRMFEQRVASDSYKPRMTDVMRLWKILRMIQGKPVNITAKVCMNCRQVHSYRYRYK